jgi:hypothetical protein
MSKYQREDSDANRTISVLIRLVIFQILAATVVNLTVFGLFGVARSTVITGQLIDSLVVCSGSRRALLSPQCSSHSRAGVSGEFVFGVWCIDAHSVLEHFTESEEVRDGTSRNAVRYVSVCGMSVCVGSHTFLSSTRAPLLVTDTLALALRGQPFEVAMRYQFALKSFTVALFFWYDLVRRPLFGCRPHTLSTVCRSH